jgi:outer membrane protein assembly factor BamA
VPGTDADKPLALARLRDALFTAGGRYDVRGWGEQQLGPKFPDVRLQATEPDTVLVAERYIPLGGLARLSGSVELRLPLFGARPRHSAHVFVDAGRVWSPDQRFRVDETSDTALRYSAGTGIELGTPVGPVRVSVGYKLNPSVYDLREPQAVLDALLAGQSPLTVPREQMRRWHLHLAIGYSY